MSALATQNASINCTKVTGVSYIACVTSSLRKQLRPAFIAAHIFGRPSRHTMHA